VLSESALWFAAQLVLAAIMILLGRVVARQQTAVWRLVAIAATGAALLWPLMRWFPDRFLHLLGSRVLMHIEVIGLIPAVLLLFTIAAYHARCFQHRRLSVWLVLMCAIYFVRNGLWMICPPVPNLGETTLWHGVCMQSTSYTCVAASLVTLLRAVDVPATETEMAHLSMTEINNGATDTRAVNALEQKLAGRDLEIRYETMDFDRLRRVDKPCLVSTKFAYFISHMVPVLEADENRVVLGDPLTGRRTISADEFKNLWSRRGIYLHAAQRTARTSEAAPELN
jgi:predicted double-glycine peptidase